MAGVKKSVLACALGALLIAHQPVLAASASQVDDAEPNAGEMTADLLVARPLGAAAFVAGTAVFLVSLPFTMLGGNVAEAGDALVAGPAKATFNRCLGCKQEGWRSQYEPVDRD